MKPSQRAQGSVLVIVLWIVIILIVVTATLAQSSRLSSRVSQSYGGQCRGRWAVRAAVETAVNVLSEDDTSYDAMDELWYDNPDEFDDIQLEGCVVSVEVTDESGKLNVNTALRNHFMNLLEMTPEQADAMIDWRDRDSEVRSEGAEADYYNSLEYPYPIRNAPFQTVHEVLFVKSIEESDFYGQDINLNGQLDENEQDDEPGISTDDELAELQEGFAAFLTPWSYCRNVDALGDDRINITTVKEDQLQQKLGLSKPHAKWIKEQSDLKTIGDLISKSTPKKKNKADQDGDEAKQIDLETFKEIADKITVSKEKILPGRVNVNTAPREVLVALLGGDEQLTEEIVAHRGGLEEPMTSIADLLDIKSMTVTTFKKIAAFVTVRSDVFSIRATATADATGLTYTARAVVARDATSCDIIYWYEGIGN